VERCDRNRVIDEGAITAITVTNRSGDSRREASGSSSTRCRASARTLRTTWDSTPVAVPDTTTFSGNPNVPDADYVIGLVQTQEKMHSTSHRR
jgi:hypothetical protein